MKRLNHTWRQIAGVVAIALLGGLVSASAYYLLMQLAADERIRWETEAVFSRAEGIAASNIAVFERLNPSQHSPCSDPDLHELRQIAHDTMYLADVGRIINDKLACTALWGVLDSPPLLPQADAVGRAHGSSLWWNKVGLVPLEEPVNLAALGTSIVVISPWIFQNYENLEPGIGFVIEDRARTRVQREIGDTDGLAGQAAETSAWYLPNRARHIRVCSDGYDVCVVGRFRMPNPVLADPLGFAAIGLAGVLGGGLLGLTLLFLLYKQLPMRQQLSRVIREDRLVVVYQPIVSLDDGTLRGAEALVRLVDVDGQWISPQRFIAAAENLGLIGLISRSVARRALRDMRDYLQHDDFYLSINLSAPDFLDPEFLPFIEAEAGAHGIDRHRIALELTERQTADHDVLAEALAKYRSAGFQILIDDFGTGYSSLAYFQELPITGIKIDKMFVQGLGESTIGCEVVKQVLALASVLDVELICEGVETQTQADVLRSMQPGLSAQGWLYSKAVEAHVFRERFATAATIRPDPGPGA